jgi:hypothetical protein
MKASRLSARFGDPDLATVLTILLAVLALGAGWMLKSAVSSQTQRFERGGAAAEFPANWLVNNGIAGEELIFTANPPLDFNFNYQVRLLPVGPAGKITDLVVARNLSLGQSLTYFKVRGQQAVQINGQAGYQVDYSYIKTSAAAEGPLVISGRDVYIEGTEKALLVTLENEASHFAESLPGFNRFIQTVKFQKGGVQ